MLLEANQHRTWGVKAVQGSEEDARIEILFDVIRGELHPDMVIEGLRLWSSCYLLLAEVHDLKC